MINSSIDELDYDSVERLSRMCLECSGTIFFGGVGKSGFVGMRTAPLSVIVAMHGDLGAVDGRSVVVMFSVAVTRSPGNSPSRTCSAHLSVHLMRSSGLSVALYAKNRPPSETSYSPPDQFSIVIPCAIFIMALKNLWR